MLAATVGAAAQPAPGSFADWLREVKAEARAIGIRPAIVDSALAGIAPIERIIELDRKQPEFTLTFEEYLARVVNDARVEKGRQKLAENRQLLDELTDRYGVPGRYIVALWGIETDFGRLTGGFKVVEALATLAFDGRRSAYFRRELLDALRILDGDHITKDQMTGSWAGAMGQFQFMPSSFLRFAVDQDGDGRRDIWNSRRDALASAANYLSQSGWRHGEGWGRAVSVPASLDGNVIGLDARKAISGWTALGVRRSDGSELPESDLAASLILVGGPAGRAPVGPASGPAFLVYQNFRTILTWNRSNLFALAVGHLADRIAAK